MPTIGSATLWAKFGLPGLVIFALLAILIGVVVFVIKRFDRIDERHTKNAKAQSDQCRMEHIEFTESHRKERQEWSDSSTRQIDKFEQALTRLADGIRDTRRD